MHASRAGSTRKHRLTSLMAGALLLAGLVQGSMAFAFNTPGAATPAVQQADGTNQEVCLRAGAGSESAVDATGHRAQRRSRVSRDPRAGIGQRAFAVWAGLALATSRAVALPGAAPRTRSPRRYSPCSGQTRSFSPGQPILPAGHSRTPMPLTLWPNMTPWRRIRWIWRKRPSGRIRLGLEPDLFEKEKKDSHGLRYPRPVRRGRLRGPADRPPGGKVRSQGWPEQTSIHLERSP